MIKKLFKSFFWDSYDSLSRVVLTSLIWAATNIPLLFFISYVLLPAKIITAQFNDLRDNIFFMPVIFSLFILTFFFPTTAAVFGHLKAYREEKSLKFFKDLWHFFKLYFWRSVGLMFINLLIYNLFLFNFWFYKNILYTNMPLIAWLLILITSWFFMFYSLLQVYVIPFMVYENTGVIASLKKSALFVFDNILISVMTFILALVVILIGFGSMIGIPVFMIGALGMLFMTAWKLIRKQYDEDTTKKPDDDNEERSLKEILVPWKKQ